MDPLTHLMAGALVGHTGSAFCPEPAATLTAIAAAILPDFDFYARKYEGSRFLKVHHGATHSISGIILQSGCTAIASWLFFHYLPVPEFREPSFSALLLISFMSVFSHIFLDWIMHNNGLPLLWPFTPHRFCFPLVLGVNPRTVSHDCGEKHYLTCFGCQSRGGFFNPVSWILVVPATFGFFTPEWRLYVGLFPWLAIALYLGFCFILRECARRYAMRFEPGYKTARAYPARARPDRWLFILDDADSVNAVLADCVKRCVMRSWHYRREALSIETSKAVKKIREDLTDTIRHLFPMEIHLESGTLIEFHDLSYLSAEPTEIGTVRVYLDSENRVIREVYQEIWS